MFQIPPQILYTHEQLRFLLGFAVARPPTNPSRTHHVPCEVLGIVNRQRCFLWNPTTHVGEDFAEELCPEGIHLLCYRCSSRYHALDTSCTCATLSCRSPADPT
jgi:hypothetical protein